MSCNNLNNLFEFRKEGKGSRGRNEKDQGKNSRGGGISSVLVVWLSLN